MNVIDRIAHTNRWCRRHPGDKLALAGGLLIVSLAVPPVPGAALVLATAVAAATLGAGVGGKDYLRLLALPAAFLVSGAAVLAVSVRLDGGGAVLAWSPQGAVIAVNASLRALAATASLLLLVATTPVADLVGVLRRIGLPAAIVDMTLLVYRFSAIALAVADASRIAQANRLGYVGFRRSVRSAGLLAAALLPRIFDHARRMQDGLAARAYDGELRVLAPAAAPSRRFIAAAVAIESALVVAGVVLAGIGEAVT